MKKLIITIVTASTSLFLSACGVHKNISLTHDVPVHHRTPLNQPLTIQNAYTEDGVWKHFSLRLADDFFVVPCSAVALESVDRADAFQWGDEVIVLLEGWTPSAGSGVSHQFVECLRGHEGTMSTLGIIHRSVSEFDSRGGEFALNAAHTLTVTRPLIESDRGETTLRVTITGWSSLMPDGETMEWMFDYHDRDYSFPDAAAHMSSAFVERLKALRDRHSELLRDPRKLHADPLEKNHGRFLLLIPAQARQVFERSQRFASLHRFTRL